MFDNADFDAHETVSFVHDARTGLEVIIALHSTYLGPAAGGTRMQAYASSDAALTDVLRLSRGMSYKNAMAGLPMGGGKAVVLQRPEAPKSEAFLLSLATAVEAFGGRYVTAEDMGMTEHDMTVMARRTRHVAGLPAAAGQVGGNPGPVTAHGIFVGMRAALAHQLARDNFRGVHVAVQGCGSVGTALAERLSAAGARLTLTDLDMGRAAALAARLGCKVVSAEAILTMAADVFSPCAAGAVLDEASIAALDVGIVAGAANNQLATPADGVRLAARGILYAPDYVINAGGIINVAAEYLGRSDPATVVADVVAIEGRLAAIFAEAARSGRSTDVVADAMAQERIGRAAVQ